MSISEDFELILYMVPIRDVEVTFFLSIVELIKVLHLFLPRLTNMKHAYAVPLSAPTGTPVRSPNWTPVIHADLIASDSE